MDILRALAATLGKMFLADLGLTLGALASAALAFVLLRTHALPAGFAPFILAAGALMALSLGVARGARVSKRSTPSHRAATEGDRR